MASARPPSPFGTSPGTGVVIQRVREVLTFTLDNPSNGNEVTGAMFDAMLAELHIMAYLGEYALPRSTFPLVLFGEPVSPQHALQIGLISQICAPEKLVGEAKALVACILRLDPDAARRCKEFFLAAQQNSLDQNCRPAIEALTGGSLAMLHEQK